MAIDYKAFIEKVRAANAIEDVIEETGNEFRLQRRGGMWIRGIEHDSLNINVAEGYYRWWSKDEEGGDVFSWVMTRQNCDFTRALEILAARARIDMPHFSKDETGPALEAKSREKVWGVAVPIMARWLREDADAWAYVTAGPAANGKPRYFSEKAIKDGQLGFTGGQAKHRFELTNAFKAAGIDPECPSAVAVLGFDGDVAAWASRWGLDPTLDDWLAEKIKARRISGLLGARRIVYPHIVGGRVVYLSGRNLPGAVVDHEGKDVKSYNPAKTLAGTRQLYFNWLFYPRISEEVIIVEGPGDAYALGQLGQPAISVMGLGLVDFADEISALCKYHGKNGEPLERTIYLGTDADKAGQNALSGKNGDWPVLKITGPLSRVVSWRDDEGARTFWVNKPDGQRDQVDVKDAGDYLAALEQARTPELLPDGTPAAVIDRGSLRDCLQKGILDRSFILIHKMAKWAGDASGAEGDKRQRLVCETAVSLDVTVFRLHQSKLAKAMGLTASELKGVVDSIQADQRKKEKEKQREVGEPTPIVGGIIHDHLIELLYDPERKTTSLAVRFPDGHIDEVDSVIIEGTRYVPVDPNPYMDGTLLLPSEIGRERPVLEILTCIQGFIHHYLDVDSGFERLYAYYAMLTWTYDMFSVVPYLRARGDFGTGKSRLIRTVGVCCYRPMLVGSATVSPIFRILDEYGGTLVLDEADFSQSDEAADIVKILNNGYEYGFPVMRTASKGDGQFVVEMYKVFGPKLIATRKRFGDEALESRCITRDMGSGVPRKGIPNVLPWCFWDEAREVRNMLLGWRMRVCKGRVDVDYNQINQNISSRLNQVTLALKTVMRDDPEALKDIDRLMEKLQHQQSIELSMNPEAKVIEAIAEIIAGPKKKMDAMGGLHWDLSIKNIANITNQIIDRENASGEDDDDEDEDKKRNKRISNKGIGVYLRNKLNFETERDRDGYYLVWDQNRFDQLKMRYGIE